MLMIKHVRMASKVHSRAPVILRMMFFWSQEHSQEAVPPIQRAPHARHEDVGSAISGRFFLNATACADSGAGTVRAAPGKFSGTHS